MANLDNLQEVAKIDKSNLLSSIEALPDQFNQAWDEVFQTSMAEDLLSVKNIVVSGMGGSALGGRIVDSLILERALSPIEVSTEFKLPNYVGPETLVVASSYSGNTQETISSAEEALAKKAKVFVISTGGKLAEVAKEQGLPSYIFKPTHNPSNQPRMGLGYGIGAVLALLAKGKYIQISEEEKNGVVETCRKFVSENSIRIPSSNNLAKRIAQNFFNKAVVLVASEHLLGVAHAFKNQLNENSKTFSVLFDLPELNHHLMEGLANPKSVKPILLFFFIASGLYSPEVRKRYPLTLEVVEKNNVATGTFECLSSTKLDQIFEVLTIGEYVSFYLSLLYDTDPTPIVWVDYFKQKLDKT
jgi:glucose/mannose-6-phosphate isomerase